MWSWWVLLACGHWLRVGQFQEYKTDYWCGWHGWYDQQTKRTLTDPLDK